MTNQISRAEAATLLEIGLPNAQRKKNKGKKNLQEVIDLSGDASHSDPAEGTSNMTRKPKRPNTDRT